VSGLAYLIRAESSGAVKIGVAVDPAKRLGSLQIGSPEPLSLIGVIPGGRPQELRLHEQFADRRIRGEWFRLTEDDIRSIVGLMPPGRIRPEYPPEFAYLVELEPRLGDLFHEAYGRRFIESRRFCANAVWYGDGGLRGRMVALVGFARRDGGATTLYSSFAYDVAYEAIYRVALPDCRGCDCPTIGDFLG
jgi:hypothetical protein